MNKAVKCDLCDNQAEIYAKTIYGYWSHLCPECNKRYSMKAHQTKFANISGCNAILADK